MRDEHNKKYETDFVDGFYRFQFVANSRRYSYFNSLKSWFKPVPSLTGSGRVNVMLSQTVLKVYIIKKENKTMVLNRFPFVRR